MCGFNNLTKGNKISQVIVFIVIANQAFQASSSPLMVDDGVKRSKRAECPPSPPGEESCIPCPDEPEAMTLKYDYTDDNGVTCTCELCLTPKFGSCTCPPGGGVGNVSCTVVSVGKTYMPYHNRCGVPFNCTVCPGNMITTKECTSNEDRECGCDEHNGYYQSGETTCERARCPKNHQAELDQKPGDTYISYTCVPCPVGFIQPKNNSSDKCYKIPPPVTPFKEDTETSTSGDGVPSDMISTRATSESVKATQRKHKTSFGQDEPTDLPQDCSKNARLLPRPILIAIVIVLMFVAFACGLYFLVLKNKCSEICQQKRSQQKPSISQSSAVQFQQSSDGGAVQV